MKKSSKQAVPAPAEQENVDPAISQATSEATASPTSTSSNKKRYPGKQQDLYLYTRLGWKNYNEHQAVFANFSGYFTRALAEDQLNFITETEALPDQEARVVEPLDAKDELVKLNKAVLDLFMDGKYYIDRNYTDPVKHATMLNAAGYGYYKKAFQKNWSSSKQLIVAFKDFLTNYGPELVENGWMPSDFPASFNTASAPFLTLWESYKDKWEGANQESSQKAKNNNLIYKVFADMCKVGRRKFAKQPELKKKFTIADLLKETAGNSPSGLQGQFTTLSGVKQVPLANARISTLVGTKKRVAISDANGYYELLLLSGDYELMLEAEGFLPQTLKKSVKIGVKSYLNVGLEQVSVTLSVEQPPIAPAPSIDLSGIVEDMMKEVGNGAH